jgi:hypothetical protein
MHAWAGAYVSFNIFNLISSSYLKIDFKLRTQLKLLLI